MTDKQLAAFQRRMRTQMTVEEMRLMGGEPNPPLPSGDQIRIVSEFIELEIRDRHRDPMQRFRQLQQTQFPAFYKTFASGFTPEKIRKND